MMSVGTFLDKLISPEICTILPGVYDPLTAILTSQAGFDSCVITGYSASATLLGKPDLGIMTQSELLDLTRRICWNSDLSTIVDGDTGHGGVLNVERLIKELGKIGANGVILEDQAWPKRCGHMESKIIVPAAEHINKLKMAVDTRTNEEFVIIARTDARAAHGLEDAIDRANRYAEAGADLVFVEAPQSVEELSLIAKQVKAPLVANIVFGGKTPILSTDELKELCYRVVLYPLVSLYAATYGIRDALDALKKNQSYRNSVDFNAFNGILGLSDYFKKLEKLT